MRRAVIIVILCSMLLSALSLSASAQSQSTFYLHADYLLDGNAPTTTTSVILKLGGGEYYVWKTVPFAAQQSFPSGTWTATIWMNTTQEPTQYRLKFGVVNSLGTFTDSFTPTITSPSPAPYEVTISLGTLSVAAGESLAIGLLRQWQNGTYSPAAFILFDSQTTPSSLTSPSVPTATTTATTTQQTTTTTQQTATTTTRVEPGPGMGFAVALMGIGVGVAAAGGGVAVAMSGRQYPLVFTYGGYYYCATHRVPVWNVRGYLWCPVDRRYLGT